MLQASLYADRHIESGFVSDSALERSRRSLSGPGLRRLVSAAYRAIQGNNAVAPLNDYLLDDIGLTRADLEALRF